MEQLVLVLLIAAISLINWLIEQSGKMRERRRLEKQSAPAPEAVPEPAVESSRPARLEDWRALLESVELAPPPLPVVESAPVPIVVPAKLPTPEVAEASRPRGRSTRSATPLRSALLPDLRSPSALRQAVLAREVLGPPRGLSSY